MNTYYRNVILQNGNDLFISFIKLEKKCIIYFITIDGPSVTFKIELNKG